jgi:hypothetical protein
LRKALVPVAAVLVVLVAAVAATAAIPDANGVIHGCRNLKSGGLRVIDTDKGQTCSKDEAAMTWNQAGPQGLAGPAGSAGPPGVSNVHISHQGFAGSGGTFPLYCPTGYTALSINFSQPGSPIGEETYSVEPIEDNGGRPIGYNVRPRVGYNTDAYLTCAITN